MQTGGNYRKKNKKQSAFGGLLRRSAKIDRRRVKRISLPLGLIITFRRFKTKKKNRSKLFNQYVYQFRVFSYKEVAVVFKKQRPSPTLLWLPRKIAKPLLTSIIVISATTLIVIQGNRATIFASANQVHGVTSVSHKVPIGPTVLSKSTPVRLRVPDVGIDTDLIKLGRQTDGTIAPPERFDVAGWYKYSPTPGELGPAIIVGHVDSYKGIAVFWHLRELKVKDLIEVDRADGTKAKFAVTEIKEVSQNNFPTSEVYGNLNYAGIRLITCGGQFSKDLHRYNHNIVVFGKLVPPA